MKKDNDTTGADGSPDAGSSGKSRRSIKIPMYNPLISPAPGVLSERRKSKDSITKAIEWLAVISWMLVGAAVALIAEAQPKGPTFLSRYFGASYSVEWDLHYLSGTFYVMVAMIVVCIVGLFLRSMRRKRKGDKYNKTFFIVGVLAIIGIVLLVTSGIMF